MGPKGPVCYGKVGIGGGRLASSLGRRHDGELVVLRVDPAMAFVASLAGSSRPGASPKGHSCQWGNTLSIWVWGNLWQGHGTERYGIEYSMVNCP